MCDSKGAGGFDGRVTLNFPGLLTAFVQETSGRQCYCWPEKEQDSSENPACVELSFGASSVADECFCFSLDL